VHLSTVTETWAVLRFMPHDSRPTHIRPWLAAGTGIPLTQITIITLKTQKIEHKTDEIHV